MRLWLWERFVTTCPIWMYLTLRRLGFGHTCVYDDPTEPEYIGFTAGICYRRGLHRGSE